MPGVQFNVSKGREVEFYNRVNGNDPTNSVFVMLVLNEVSSIYDLRDYETLSSLLGDYDEVSNTGYSRKTINDAAIGNYTIDHTNNRIPLTLPLQTFATISAGDNWDVVVVCYDNDSTGGTDANIVPISAHELRISGTLLVPNGDDILVDLSSAWITAV